MSRKILGVVGAVLSIAGLLWCALHPHSLGGLYWGSLWIASWVYSFYASLRYARFVR